MNRLLISLAALWAVLSLPLAADPVATIMPESNPDHFDQWAGSNFDTFFHDGTTDYSKYDGLIFFPMTFDRMNISELADEKFQKSWYDSTFEEMDRICSFFDEAARKTFRSSRDFNLTRQGGSSVLAVEFRMKDFMPTSVPRGDAIGTIGVSSNTLGVGSLVFQAVLVESQSGKLVAVVEDAVEVKSMAQSINDRVGRNLAWKRTFQRIVDNFHEDLRTLKKSGVG